ncbi:MAG: YraN family protein [Rhodobacteraceae bacterium]|nr:YraN family protein [Paracoccaceae bacterium]
MTGTAKVARGRAAETRGRRAEFACVIYLRLTGWRILAQRLTGRRGSGVGEIDIVAARGNTVAMIEVKARDDLTDALGAVGVEQRARLVRAAERFLARHPEIAARDVRFDVMTVGRWYWPRRHPDAWRPD